MKILVLSHLYPNRQNLIFGRFVHAQCLEMVKDGNTVKVIAPVPFVPPVISRIKPKWQYYSRIPREDTLDMVHVFYPRIPFPPKGWGYQWTPVVYLFQALFLIIRRKEHRTFHVIHAHAAMPDGLVGIILGKMLRIPLVVTTHGDDLQHRIFQNITLKGAIRFVYQHCGLIAVVSEKLRSAIHEHFPGIPAEKIRIVYNGISPSLKKNKVIDAHGLDSTKKILLSVGHLIPIKGHEWVLQALPGILKIHPAIIYLIIGEGPEEFKLRKMIDSLQLSEKVIFLGKKSHDEVLSYMEKCDIFILPSYNESFGIVYIEAMSLGKVVIACSDQGISDILRNGENGFLVPPQNSQSITKTVNTLLRKPELAAWVGRNAKRSVTDRFTWPYNAREYLCMYRSFMDK